MGIVMGIVRNRAKGDDDVEKREDFHILQQSLWDLRQSKLIDLFGCHVTMEGLDKFSINTDDHPVNNTLPILLEVTKIMDCSPEELFFNADKRSTGYCDTCYSDWPVLAFEVRRKVK